tara:strand:- start:710 stop:1294 length:585 start_codon:yes stop_codon:yes gene_type:complete
MRKVSIADAIVETPWGIDICPTNERAGEVGAALEKEYYGHESLRDALASIEDDYDIVLLDCPPSLKSLTASAVYAADWVISPMELSFLSFDRLVDLQAEAERVCVKAGAPPISVLVVRYDGREKVLNELLLKTLADEEAHMMETRIPASTKVKQAQSAGMPVQEYAPRSPASKAFKALAQEIKLVAEGGSRVAA